MNLHDIRKMSKLRLAFGPWNPVSPLLWLPTTNMPKIDLLALVDNLRLVSCLKMEGGALKLNSSHLKQLTPKVSQISCHD